MSGAPVPGVVNVHQVITPGGSPQVLRVKALRNTEKKVYGSDDLSRFCEEEDETFDHLINECPCFYLDRVDLLQN